MGEKGIWCGICAKYLAFGTYPTSTVDAPFSNAIALNIYNRQPLYTRLFVWMCKAAKVSTLNFKKLPEKRNLRLFLLFVLFSFSATKPKHKHIQRERERERDMGVVVGVILDESALLASNSPQHENPSLQPVADSLLRKLRHSKIPTVFSLSSSTSLFFAQYIITTVLGFLWFEVYKLFLWSITQSLCIYNYKFCSGYLLFCQSNGSDYPNELIMSVL